MRNPPLAMTEDNFCAVVDLRSPNPKTETRRLLTIKDRSQEYVNEIEAFHKDQDGGWVAVSGLDANNPEWVKKAYPKDSNKGIKSRLQVGDCAYLKEPTQVLCTNPEDLTNIESCNVAYFWGDKKTTYEGISDRQWVDLAECDSEKLCNRKTGIYSKQGAMFMLKSFARYSVTVTDVKIERLMDITAEAAIAEGIKFEDHYSRRYWDYMAEDYSFKNPIDSYISEIEMLHGKAIAQSNPWMWVYKFKLVNGAS